MARIITQIYEHTTRALLEAALATRELGYTDESGNESLSFKTNAGAFRRFPSLTLLARSSSAALIGYDPTTSGMAATTLQAAIDELKSSGTGGTLTGAGTTNSIPLWTSASGQGNSILSQVSSKVRVGGDASANLYLYSAGVLGSDGDLRTGGQITVGTNLIVPGLVSLATGGSSVSMGGGFSTQDATIQDKTFDSSTANGQWAALFEQTLTKNNSNTRTFYGARVVAILNAGGSNTNTTFNLISGDTINTSLTGLTVNLLYLRYGGADRFIVDSFGNATSSQGDFRAGRDVIAQSGVYGKTLSIGFSPSNFLVTPTNGAKENVVAAWFQRNTAGALEHSLFSAYGILDAGASNTLETINLISCDTLAVGATTGITINVLKLYVGGVEKFTVSQNGDITKVRRIFSSELVTPLAGVYSNGSGYLQNNSIYSEPLLGNTGIGAMYTNAKLYINSNGFPGPDTADIEFADSYTTPTPVAALATVKQYYRGGKVVFVVNDGGTVRYKYLDMSGTGATWAHTTTAI